MKKLFSLILALLFLPVIALSEIPYDQLAGLSKAQKTILSFNVDIAIARKENGGNSGMYSYDLNMDLMDLSLEELRWMFDYLHGNADLPDQPKKETILSRHGIEITESREIFTKENRLVFCLYSTIAQTGRKLGYVMQVYNPEISLDVDNQRLSYAYFYMNCYENAAVDDLRNRVEEYTDVLIATLTATYPDLTFDSMWFCWKIPAIHPDNLYTATFWGENSESGIVRGEGKGVLYQ